MSNEPLLISDNLVIHVDVPTEADAIQFRDLLDSMGMLQHVKRPTPIRGHTLGLLISDQSDDIIATKPETEIFLRSCGCLTSSKDS